MLDLISHHLLEEVAGEAEGEEGADEDPAHRYGNGEQEALDLAFEHLGVSEAQHDVVEGDGHRHHEAN